MDNRFLKFSFLTCLLLLTMAVSFGAAAGESNPPPEFSARLSEEEKAFLARTDVVRVHNESDWAPFNFNAEGSPKGFSVEYMKLLALKTGLQITFVNGPTWDQFLEMMKKGELDVMLNIAKSPERQQFLDFTPPYVTMIQMLYTRSDFPSVASIKDLYGKRFAVPTGFYLHRVLKEHPDIQIIEVANTTEAIMAVSTGRADAMFDLMPVVEYITKQLQVRNLRVGGTLGLDEGKPIPLHIAVRKDMGILAGILEKGMKTVSDDEMDRLHGRWMTGTSQKQQIAQDGGSVDLSAEEMEFLKGKHVNLGIDTARPPFEFIDDNNNYAGISAEFMSVLCKRLGIGMAPQRNIKWAEAMEKVKVGEIDVIPKVTPSPERGKHMLFTRPYITFPSVIITRKDTFISGMDDLVGRSIGVVKGLIIETSLKRDRPDLNLVPCSDIESALRDLSVGKFDAFIDNLGTVSYSIDKIGLTNLKIAASTPYTHDLAIGVRKDWPLLASALDKALATLTDKEKAEIKNHWLAIQIQPGINWKVVGPVVGALVAIITFVLIWNRRLGLAVRERERAEAELRVQAEELQAQQIKLQETEAWFRSIIESAPDGMLVVDERGAIVLANTMVDRMFGYDSGELLGRNVDDLVPTAIRHEHKPLRDRFVQTSKAREIGRGLDLRGVRKDGSEYPVEIGLSMLPASGSRGLCVCASIRDITERKAAEHALAESRARLQMLLDTSPIAVSITTDGTIRFANPRFTELMGLGIDDSVAQLYEDPADRDRLVEHLTRQESLSDYHLRLRGSDQQVFDILATFIRTEYKGEPGVLSWLVDISKIKAIEKALSETEERSRLLLESAGEGIFGVDTSGRLTFVNPAALELLGYKETELLGQKVHPIIHHSRSDGSQYSVEECPMMESYRKGVAHNVANEVLWRKDGTSFYVNYSSTPMRKDGSVIGAVVTFRDVTERRRAEEEIRRYLKELERFNQLVTGREVRMIHLKNEINALRAEMGKSAKYMAAVEAAQDREFSMFGDQREHSVFGMDLIGNIGEGRPNLGSTIDIALYRLMQFSIRDVLLRKFSPEIAARVFFEAGEMTGRELCKALIKKTTDFETFIRETQEVLANLKIGMLEMEKVDLENMCFTLTVSEDLDCSGMPASNETICTYDEGFLSGLLSQYTGTRFHAREISCWCSGDRLCRFELKPAA